MVLFTEQLTKSQKEVDARLNLLTPQSFKEVINRPNTKMGIYFIYDKELKQFACKYFNLEDIEYVKAQMTNVGFIDVFSELRNVYFKVPTIKSNDYITSIQDVMNEMC